MYISFLKSGQVWKKIIDNSTDKIKSVSISNIWSPNNPVPQAVQTITMVSGKRISSSDLKNGWIFIK